MFWRVLSTHLLPPADVGELLLRQYLAYLLTSVKYPVLLLTWTEAIMLRLLFFCFVIQVLSGCPCIALSELKYIKKCQEEQ